MATQTTVFSKKKDNFFERNKKKSLLALLLLFLRRRGPLIALLVVMLLMLAFIGPKKAGTFFVRALDGIPVIGKPLAKQFAKVVPMEGMTGAAAGDYSGLRELWRQAREKSSDAWNLFSDRSGKTKGGAVTEDSTAMVRGHKADLNAATNGRGVSSILSPDAARERGSAVELSQADLQGQRQEYAQGAGADGPYGSSGEAGKSDAADQFGGFGPYTSKGFFSSGQSAATDRAGSVQGALSGTQVPVANRQKAQNQGKITGISAKQGLVDSHLAGNHNPARGNAQWRSLAQLGDTRAYAMLAKDPLCTSSNGCPPEYASTNVGLTYDGVSGGDRANVIQADGADAPKVNGIDVPNPNVPDDSKLDQYISETNNIDGDAVACREADQLYGPQESTAMSDYLGKRQAACDAGCPRDAQGDFTTQYMSQHYQQCGGLAGQDFSYASQESACCGIPIIGWFCCSQSSQFNGFGGINTGYATFYNQCSNLVGQVDGACQTLDNIRLAHYNACPISQKDGAFQPRCNVPPDSGGFQIPECTTPTAQQAPQCQYSY